MHFDDNPTLVDLIRHGEPEGGARFRGSQDDPLSALGWQQMRSAILPEERWDRVVTSPLLRCQQFADEVASRLGVPLHLEPRLQEIGFGEWEGLTAEEIRARDGELLDQFWRDAAAVVPPGAESMVAFTQRVQSAWQDWTRECRGQRVLLVCHGGVIRAVLGHILTLPLERTLSAFAVPYASRSRIRLDDTPHGTLTCLLSHGYHD